MNRFLKYSNYKKRIRKKKFFLLVTDTSSYQHVVTVPIHLRRSNGEKRVISDESLLWWWSRCIRGIHICIVWWKDLDNLWPSNVLRPLGLGAVDKVLLPPLFFPLFLSLSFFLSLYMLFDLDEGVSLARPKESCREWVWPGWSGAGSWIKTRAIDSGPRKVYRRRIKKIWKRKRKKKKGAAVVSLVDLSVGFCGRVLAPH